MSNYFEITDHKNRIFFFRVSDVRKLELHGVSGDPERPGATVEHSVQCVSSYDNIEAYFKDEASARAVYDELKARLLGAEKAAA